MIIFVVNVAQWNTRQMSWFSGVVFLANVTKPKLFETIRELGLRFVKTKSNSKLNDENTFQPSSYTRLKRELPKRSLSSNFFFSTLLVFNYLLVKSTSKTGRKHVKKARANFHYWDSLKMIPNLKHLKICMSQRHSFVHSFSLKAALQKSKWCFITLKMHENSDI